MMLVVAVALSTATYAWFTSNATVTASTISMKAEVNGASSLGIGWLGGDANTSIAFANYEILKPMAPNDLSVGTTTSDVIFRSATIKEENSTEKFNNDKADSYVVATGLTVGESSVVGKYLKEGGYYVPATGVAAEGKTYYTKNFAPIVFNNGSGVQAFYVKNTSHTNAIGTITVSANFTQNNAYILTQDTTFLDGTTYYTTADQGENFTPAEVTVGDSVTADTYYEKVTANDMIRVAIFTKAAYVNGSGTPAATYTLLGVLGSAATDPTAVTGAYDRNTTYYTESGGVYTQANINAFADATDYYTIANTAAYGATGKFDVDDNVKDLDHYLNVATSLTLTGSLAHDAQIDIVAVAWFDGTLLTDARAGELGQVSLSFTAA